MVCNTLLVLCCGHCFPGIGKVLEESILWHTYSNYLDKKNDNREEYRVKHGGGTLMVWVCMSEHGVGERHFIDGIINADMYYNILNAEMIPSLKHIGREAIYQHDHDSNHSAMMTSAFLKKKKGKVLDWPSMFPDQELRDVI